MKGLDLPARGDSHGDVRGVFRLEVQLRGVHLPGQSAAVHPMPILPGGVNHQLHDIP